MSALVLGSALGPAAPAGAAVRSATYTWAPATGPVSGYRLYASIDGDAETFFATVDQPTATISVESGASMIVSVAAYDSAGRVGPRSNASVPLRLCPGDFDGDEVLEDSDQNNVRDCMFQPATDDCAGADMDGNGNVNFLDFFALELGADACRNLPTPGGCPEDVNGDGFVTVQDVLAVQRCFLMSAQGSCQPADVDGTGSINSIDWSLVKRAIGTLACSN